MSSLIRSLRSPRSRPLKLAATVLIFAVLTSTSALALPCAGAAKQLGLLSRNLAHRDIGAANGMLSLLVSSYPDCPELMLAAARLATLRGEADEAATPVCQISCGNAPDGVAGKAYLARFLVGPGRLRSGVRPFFHRAGNRPRPTHRARCSRPAPCNEGRNNGGIR